MLACFFCRAFVVAVFCFIAGWEEEFGPGGHGGDKRQWGGYDKVLRGFNSRCSLTAVSRLRMNTRECIISLSYAVLFPGYYDFHAVGRYFVLTVPDRRWWMRV